MQYKSFSLYNNEKKSLTFAELKTHKNNLIYENDCLNRTYIYPEISAGFRSYHSKWL